MKLAGPLTAAVLAAVCLAAPAGASALTAAAATAQEPTTVTLVPPTVTEVALGTTVRVVGVVSGAAGRTARLERRTAGGWAPLAEASTDDTGGYDLAVPTDWFSRASLRVSVPATDVFLAGSSADFDLAVVPSYVPRGSASDWARLVQGVRWDPCGGPITWKVNRAGVPDRRVTELRRAIRTLHEATGLTFSYAGETTAVPFRTDGRGSATSDADLTVAFSTARQTSGLAGTVVGQGGVTYRSTREVVRGLVVLDQEARLDAGFGVGHTWGTLMLHELGHAVGLAHASGLDQAMHSGITSRSRGTYQAGDLTGLSRQGVAGGCFVAPLARTTGVTRTVSAH